MNRKTASLIVSMGSLLFGCGGSCPGAADATSAETPAAEATPGGGSDESAASDEHAEHADRSSGDESADKPSSDAKPSEGATGPDPSFPENASVAQAVAAVPRGTQRANIEPDVLGEPLQNAALYEPCKAGGQHFKLKVAVWGGKAVGVDVTTPNKNLAECIAKQVRTIEWHDKVRSLNTVEYSM